MAFQAASGSGAYGDAAEVICMAVNLILGAAGAFTAFLVGKGLQDAKVRPIPALTSVFLGLVAGLAGYYWLWWELSHADLPL
jgi:hypothetical protein